MNRQRGRYLIPVLAALTCAAVAGTGMTSLTVLADEAEQDQVQGTVVCNYAVQLYGIGQDTMIDDTTGGLTFGPAVGGDYLNVTLGHDPSGKTTTGNVHRCVNKDSWEQIVDYSYDDPYIYEQCIDEGCIALVPITATAENSYAGYNNDYVLDSEMAMPMEGGAGALYWELQDEARQYAATNLDEEGELESYSGLNWANSQIRAMLNGAQAETGDYGGSRYSYDSETHTGNSLLAGFPITLQESIGYKKVSYATSYKDMASVDTCGDQLWLLSNMEMYGNDEDSLADYMKGKAAYLNEGAQYQRNEPIISTLLSTNELAVAYRSDAGGDGVKTSWWLRSRFASTSNDRYVSYVASSGVLGAADATYDAYSVSPAFTLNTDPTGPHKRDDDPEDPGDPGQPADPGNPGSGDSGSGSSGSGSAATVNTVASADAADLTDAAATLEGIDPAQDAAAEGTGTTSVDDGSADGNTASSQTGDDSPMMVYAEMVIASVLVLVIWGTIYSKRSRMI